MTETPEPEAVHSELGTDTQPLLDQELSRLPDRYRAVIVLCGLEGKTRKEAARQLGLPEGTVASRLVRWCADHVGEAPDAARSGSVGRGFGDGAVPERGGGCTDLGSVFDDRSREPVGDGASSGCGSDLTQGRRPYSME